MRIRTVVAIPALALGVLALAGIHARAQDDDSGQPVVPSAASERLTVRAHARATAPADELELELVVEASGDEAKDAERKHREKLARVLAVLSGTRADKAAKSSADGDATPHARKHRKKPADEDDDDDTPAAAPDADEPRDALPPVGVPDADGLVYEVHEGRSTLGIQGGQGDGQEDPNATEKKDSEVRVGTAVQVVFKHLAKVPARKLHRLVAATIDRAAEAGADMTSSKTSVKPAIRFRCADAEALKKKAYADAVARGRARAEELARLAGRKLGKLTCVTELDPPAAPAQTVPEGWTGFVNQFGNNDQGNDDGVSASSEVAITVQVQLEFELQ